MQLFISLARQYPEIFCRQRNALAISLKIFQVYPQNGKKCALWRKAKIWSKGNSK